MTTREAINQCLDDIDRARRQQQPGAWSELLWELDAITELFRLVRTYASNSEGQRHTTRRDN